MIKTEKFQEQVFANEIDTCRCSLETNAESIPVHTMVILEPSAGSNFERNPNILENNSHSLLLVAEQDNSAGPAVPEVILTHGNGTRTFVTTSLNDETQILSTIPSIEDKPVLRKLHIFLKGI